MSLTIEMAPRTIALARANWNWLRWRDLSLLEMYGIETPVVLDEPIAPDLLQAIAAGVIRATRGNAAVDMRLDASSFCAWLLRSGVEAPKQPLAVSGIDSTSREIHPATAAAWIAFGEALAPERVAAFLHRVHRVQLMLCDHDAGRVVLDPETLALANETVAAKVAFDAACIELEIAIRTLTVQAYAADEGRILHAGDFAGPITLDVVKARYVAGPAAQVLSDDWYRAAAAAKRIGAVRLSGSDLIKKFGRRRSNAWSRRRATAALRALFELSRRGDGPLPKRVDWEPGLGAELAGSKYAAGEVWKEVTNDPTYAAARARGRRPDWKNDPK